MLNCTHTCVLNLISKASRWIAFKDIQILESLWFACMCSSVSLVVCSFKRKVTFCLCSGPTDMQLNVKFVMFLSYNLNIALVNHLPFSTILSPWYCWGIGPVWNEKWQKNALSNTQQKSPDCVNRPLSYLLWTHFWVCWLSCGLISESRPFPPSPKSRGYVKR